MENIIIHVDSFFRDKDLYTDSGKFTYKLKNELKNISYIRLSSLEFPAIYYTFLEKYNNTSFTIMYGSYTSDITIQEGNYDSASIISQIQSQFDIINNDAGTTFTISWDSINYKITFTNITAFTIIFNNTKNHRSLGDRLGFKLDNESYLAIYQVTKFFPSSNIDLYFWIGESILDITKDDYMFFKINDYGIIYNDVRPNGLLAKIILYDQQFINDTGANLLTKSYHFKKPVNISKFDIELVNKFGETIDMQTINYSFTLELGQIYDSTQYNNYDFQL
jgi:hypothetical protein